ncbi:MAG: phage holin family protein [Methanoregulaceae archaeon]|nr:phage holin family protein [Methanoregulaceae archaeon]
MPPNERQIKSQMKVGVGLAVFGLACPFFWLSLFNSTTGFETWVYGIHSGFFIVIGLILLGKGWYDLKRMPIKME